MLTLDASGGLTPRNSLSILVRARPAPRGIDTMAPWTLGSALLAPLSLVACWLAAGFVQGGDYDAARQTISVLAGHAASHRWIMTLGLYSVSVCQILTAIGLTVARPLARILLGVGGVAGLGVAMFPQPPHGTAASHLVWATLSVSLLAVWPATIGSRSSVRPFVLTVRGSMIATAVFLALLAWLFAAAHGGGALGIAERVDTAIANAWPLVVVLAIRRARARGHLLPAPPVEFARKLRRNASVTTKGQQDCSAEPARSARPSAGPCWVSTAIHTNSPTDSAIAAIERPTPTA